MNVISLFGEAPGFGAWGDFFGGVLNPILTFLTFMGLLITIVLQQSELKESRKEFKRSADALVEQSHHLRRQKFETTFFNMISFLNECAVNYEILDDENKKIKGRDVFQYYHGKLIHSIEFAGSVHGDEEIEKRIERGVESFSFHHGHEIAHYFGQIKNVLKLIHSSRQGDKELFANILSSQLTSHEKGILFHYAFPDKEYMRLVDRYKILVGLSQKHFTYDPRIFSPYQSVKYK
jgi:hypothetical protein